MRSKVSVKRSPPKSRFEISIRELEARLAKSELPRTQRRVLDHALEALHEDDRALWVDVPWSELERGALASDSARTAALVFTKPLLLQHALLLRHDKMLGVEQKRDHQIYVFLEAVRARDLCSVPDTLAIFAKGLTVKRLASFESPDGHAEVAGHLKAPMVLANVAGGGVRVAPGTHIEVGAYARQIRGLPKGTSAVKHASLRALLPFLEDDGDHEGEDPWAIAFDLVESGRPFPKNTKKRGQKDAARKQAVPSVRGKTFAFTGKIADRWITMAMAKDSVVYGGGKVATTITPDVDYLVVGDKASPLIGTGPKTAFFERAEQLNARGAKIMIVREEYFFAMKK